MGRPQDALDYYNLSLESRIEEFGKDHQFTAACYNGIGTAYMGLGQIDKALLYL